MSHLIIFFQFLLNYSKIKLDTSYSLINLLFYEEVIILFHLFISHSSDEYLVSKEMKTCLNNAFKGKIECVNASEDLGSGQAWKEFIKKNLNLCDACIILLSPSFIKSLWSVAEFTAFWFRDKPIFILCMGSIEIDKLPFIPMRDLQITSLEDEDKISVFLKNISQIIGEERIPYTFAQVIRNNCMAAYKKSLKNKNEQMIADIKSNNRLITSRYSLDEFSNLNDEQFLAVMDVIPDMDLLRLILEDYFIKNRKSQEIINFGIEKLAKNNNAELRKLIYYFMDHDFISENIFDFSINILAKNNETELIKVLKKLFEIDESKFNYYIEKELFDNEIYKKKIDDFIKKQNSKIEFE